MDVKTKTHFVLASSLIVFRIETTFVVLGYQLKPQNLNYILI